MSLLRNCPPRRLGPVATGLVAGLLLAAPLAAQVPPNLPANLPPPAQAQQLLQNNPDLAAQLRARIAASGLSPDQIRARLRAAGYPDNFLDDYLQGADTTRKLSPGSNTLDAVKSLGIIASSSLDSLRGFTDSTRAAMDSLRADSLRRLGGGLRVFGLDIFRSSNSLFEPNLGGPVDDAYRLGPGDELVLVLTGDVEQAYTLDVTREGFIVIPSVGQVSVANLTFAQMRQLLGTRLAKAYSGVNRGTLKFDVSIARLRTNQIYVVGDVARPGSYQVASSGTILSALYAAGGPTENGSFRRIDLRRGGKLVDSLDLYDYLLRGDNTHDNRLQTGDVVFVPVHGAQVKATGELLRPAIYELKPGQTLRDLIAAAGGFTPQALRRRVQIVRVLPPARRLPGGRDRVVVDLASDQFDDGLGPAFPMEAGDSVRVFTIADRQRLSVRVIGNVWVPGTVGFTPGMKLSEAIQLSGGPRPDVYLGSILLSRLQPDSSRIQLRSAFRDSTGVLTEDIPLQEDDEITVFSRTSFRPSRYVAVTGAVNSAGQIPYHEGMTLRDAVLLAGGVTEDALLTEAEIARLPADRAGGILATTIRVPLDSSYLGDRSPNGHYPGPPGIAAPASGAPEIVLLPYDNVLILRQPEWELQRTVMISGQVMYPGHYSLKSKSERLTDLLHRAGGLTANAYPDAIQFYRKAERAGRVGIDLPEVLKDSTFRDNLILIGGDSIIIPEFDPIVYVSGAVNAPVAVSYVPGKDVDYYVQAAGGYALQGDKSRTYTTQPSGKVQSVKRRFLIADYRPKPLAGAKVYVPVKPPADKAAVIATIGSVAQILASIVAIIAIAVK